MTSKLRMNVPGIVLAGLLLAGTVEALQNTWLGNTTNSLGQGVWSDTLNWSQGWIPQAGDDVVIPNTTNKPYMTATNYPTSGVFTSFTVDSGATVYCLGNTNVINESSGGSAGTNHGVGVTIMASAATISGTLNADGNGFGPGFGPGAGSGAAGSLQAASYGGRGGWGGTTPSVPTYGRADQPTALGSGANYAGGGAIKLDISGGTLTVNGTITANAGTMDGGASGGSGGSVWLVCDTLNGIGRISADGGKSQDTNRGAGGGGRVAIACTTYNFTGGVSAERGVNSGTINPLPGGLPRLSLHHGEPGTLYHPGKFPYDAVNIVVTNSFNYMLTTNQPYNWGTLTVSNGAMVWFNTDQTNGTLNLSNVAFAGNSGLRLYRGKFSITNQPSLVNGALAVEGATLGFGSLSLNNFEFAPSNTVFRFGDVFLTNNASCVVDPSCDAVISNSITLENSALTLKAQTWTLAGDLKMSTNSTLTCLGDTNAINSASGGTSGTRHGIGVTLSCQKAMIKGTVLTVGFPAMKGPGGRNSNTDAASYGGRGWYATNSTPIAAYGVLGQPTALGSGGSGYSGGGAIKLVASQLQLDGTISATNGPPVNSAGASGGSIWLIVDTFSGTGVVNAAGQSKTNDTNRGAGGGGRVAIEYGTSTFSGRVSVAKGVDFDSGTKNGETGTLFRVSGRSSAPDAPALASTFATNSFTNGLVVTRAITAWKPRTMVWTDMCMDGGSNQFNNVVTNRLSGLLANQNYWITDNGTSLFGGAATNSGPSGTLQFIVNLNAQHTLDVRAPAAGTVITVW